MCNKKETNSRKQFICSNNERESKVLQYWKARCFSAPTTTTKANLKELWETKIQENLFNWFSPRFLGAKCRRMVWYLANPFRWVKWSTAEINGETYPTKSNTSQSRKRRMGGEKAQKYVWALCFEMLRGHVYWLMSSSEVDEQSPGFLWGLCCQWETWPPNLLLAEGGWESGAASRRVYSHCPLHRRLRRIKGKEEPPRSFGKERAGELWSGCLSHSRAAHSRAARQTWGVPETNDGVCFHLVFLNENVARGYPVPPTHAPHSGCQDGLRTNNFLIPMLRQVLPHLNLS